MTSTSTTPSLHAGLAGEDDTTRGLEFRGRSTDKSKIREAAAGGDGSVRNVW
jgi:hypothetical protein